MKKIAVLQAEFDSDIMICDEDLKKYYNNDWLKFMQELFEDESIGLFDDIKLVDILDKKIEKIKYYDDSIAWVIDGAGQLSDIDKITIDKINEIIDYLMENKQ